MPCNVLITGATGFLASKLIIELAEKTSCHFYCLVRANDDEIAKKRLRESILRHGNVSPKIMERITAICGDLAAFNLGFSQAYWDDLASIIDTVFHSGATVNLVATYKELFDANVNGTREILRFVCSGKPKKLHYISTLSVFVSSDYNQSLICENADLEKAERVYGGYAQSKWVGDYLLNQARLCGVEVYIYRLGLVTGDSQTGICNKQDFLSKFLRALLQYKCLPEVAGLELQVDITPIDYAAQAIAHLSLYTDKYHIYNIANPQPLKLSQIIEWLKKYGLSIDILPADKWAQMFDNKKANEDDSASFYLSLCRCFSGGLQPKYKALDLFQVTELQINTQNTFDVLKNYNIHCPIPNYELIAKYLKYISTPF